MIPHLVPEIEGGYPERDGEEEEEEGGEGLVLENSRSWIYIRNNFFRSYHALFLYKPVSCGSIATTILRRT